jgi:hypothetical protein
MSAFIRTQACTNASRSAAVRNFAFLRTPMGPSGAYALSVG